VNGLIVLTNVNKYPCMVSTDQNKGCPNLKTNINVSNARLARQI